MSSSDVPADSVAELIGVLRWQQQEDTQTIARLTTRLAEVERERDLLKKAVEHYADRSNWNPISDDDHIRDWYVADRVESNGYDIAQAALKDADAVAREQDSEITEQ